MADPHIYRTWDRGRLQKPWPGYKKEPQFVNVIQTGSTVEIQQRIIRFIRRTNWILFAMVSLAGILLAPAHFAWGIIAGGAIVTINFHLLARTLKNALTPPYLSSHHVILAKYYVRFIIFDSPALGQPLGAVCRVVCRGCQYHPGHAHRS